MIWGWGEGGSKEVQRLPSADSATCSRSVVARSWEDESLLRACVYDSRILRWHTSVCNLHTWGGGRSYGSHRASASSPAAGQTRSRAGIEVNLFCWEKETRWGCGLSIYRLSDHRVGCDLGSTSSWTWLPSLPDVRPLRSAESKLSKYGPGIS
jgi:hypothetical protein